MAKFGSHVHCKENFTSYLLKRWITMLNASITAEHQNFRSKVYQSQFLQLRVIEYKLSELQGLQCHNLGALKQDYLNSFLVVQFERSEWI